MLLTILKKRQRRASARLCWRERLIDIYLAVILFVFVLFVV